MGKEDNRLAEGIAASSKAEVANSQPFGNAPRHLTLEVLSIPPTVRLPAQVKHLLAKESVLLSEAVSSALDLPQDFVRELIRFGAVHWCAVPPPPPTGDTFLRLGNPSAAFLARQAALKEFGQYPAHQTPRRASQDVPVNQHAYIRVHVHPRRSPAFYTCDWKSRVVHDCEEYVVISKPPGVPVAPTVDNILECTLTGAAQAIGFEGPLLITHRLDRCTEGLTVIGKTTAFVRRFNLLLQGHKGQLHKFYRTLTGTPPPLGTMIHHVCINTKIQGMPPHTRVHDSPVPGSLHAELEVLEPDRFSASANHAGSAS
ncbi:hypothetical protein WJX73_000798 [Symbiochloris irregularis]|uniref:Pseudouridine synthase RsuA/RluA-like domain-containing protein n=1 Tax=Symbiochloris irregularis TaxID=706552 RepID=A0AAW1Q261_9CHLO